jgi:16S rRNA (cytosine1402-N4)-methyltransferase
VSALSIENDYGFSHQTVLLSEAVDALSPRDGAVYCDGTLGGGGHAEQILERAHPNGRLLGVDRDPAALAAACKRLERFGDRVILAHGSFGELPQILAKHADALKVDRVDGVLVDLGVSSPQLDHAHRGFSFRREGPLDMRMDNTQGETARELCARLSVDELADLIRAYGDERYAGRIARTIKENIEADRLHTTTELASAIAQVIPTRERGKDPATRTFQALRIAVNDELGEVERLVNAAPDLLAPGGRIAVISFHSLEDGIVKHRLREMSKEPNVPPDLAEQMGIPQPTMRVLTRKPIEPSEVEVAANPRARSAKLRVAERR